MIINELTGALTPEIVDIAKIFVLFLGLVHFLYVAIFFQSVLGVTKLLRTPKNPIFLTWILLHLVLLAGILIFIFIY